MPRVSLLIPCFHAEGFVGEAIACALRQTYPHVEILISPDDGATYEHIRRVFPSPQLRVLPPGLTSGSGPGVTRNRAIDAAHGDFFTLLDADDLIPDDFVEKMIAVAREEGAAVCNTHYLTLDGAGVVRIPNIHKGRLSLSGYGQLLASVHGLVHRSLEPGFVEGFAEDVVRDGLILAKQEMVSIVDTHYGARLREGSLCSSGPEEERKIQDAYEKRIDQCLHHPTSLGVHRLSGDDRRAFAQIFRFRASVSALFSAQGRGLSYQAFVKDKEAALWDKFCLAMAKGERWIPSLA